MMQGSTQVAVQPHPTPAPVRVRWPFVIAAAMVAVLLVAGLLIWLAAGARDDRRHALAAPIGGRDSASLNVASRATTVTVHTSNLGDDLYRIATPRGTATIPVIDGAGDEVRLRLTEGGPGVVDIQLSAQVTWQLRFTGGADRIDADLTRGRLSAVDFTAGTSAIELTLPYPSGEVPIRMSAGVDRFVVHTPSNAPAWVRVGGGADSVTIDGVTRTGVSAGTAFASDEWHATSDRYAIECTAGTSTFTLDRDV
jgi:hypothetical protein